MMKDIMIDIETLSANNNAVIVSISAVQFNLVTGKTGETFEIGISLEEQQKLGRDIAVDTVTWWLQQEKEAQHSLLSIDKVSIAEAIKGLNTFIATVASNCNVQLKKLNLWGNGSSFDNAIVRSLYKDVNSEFLLPYYCDRDVRTLVQIAMFNPFKVRFDGIKHNGIDDCKHQIKYCNMAYKQLLGMGVAK